MLTQLRAHVCLVMNPNEYKSYLPTHDRDIQIDAGLLPTGLFSKSDQDLSINIYIVWFEGRKPGPALL